jgi:hypothetical protein
LVDRAAFAGTQRSESVRQTLFLIRRQRRSLVDRFHHIGPSWELPEFFRDVFPVPVKDTRAGHA